MGKKSLSCDFQLQYDWTEEKTVDSFKRNGKKFLKEILNDYIENHQSVGGLCLWEKVWPTLRLANNQKDNIEKAKYELILVPLNRLKAEPGKSGSNVLICYFCAKGLDYKLQNKYKDCVMSLPMIVKSTEKTKKRTIGTTRVSKLKEEYDASEKVSSFIQGNTSFAMPIRYDPNTSGDNEFLWSLFKASAQVKDQNTQYDMELKTLYDEIFEETDKNKIMKEFEQIYDLLVDMHVRCNLSSEKEEEVIYEKEYKFYLRDICSAEKQWRKLWDDNLNPFDVLNNILKRKVCLPIGAIHGDLHPRNVVVTKNALSIIDFGWADSNANIAKDFVLMECNLRFVILFSNMPMQSVEKLAKSIEDYDIQKIIDDKTEKNKQLKAICNWIIIIRKKYKYIRNLRKNQVINWGEEYIIPLFIVAMGLIKYINSYMNQASMIITIQELAEYIDKIS